MKKIYVIVLNWNGKEDTIECISSLSKQKNSRYNIVLVDNSSTDGSANEVQKTFPNVIVIRNKQNLGYAGGMNVGIKYALTKKADYVLILNNDVILDEKLLWYLESNTNDNVLITSPVIYYKDKPELIWSVGGMINPILLEMTKPQGGDNNFLNKPMEKDFLSGCALFIDSSVFERIGYFDERFFPGYYEDLDFCLRAKKNKIKMQVIPDAKIWHKVSQSSGGEESPNVTFLMARNSGYYFKKHIRLWNAVFVIIYRLGSAIKKSIYFLVIKKYDCLKAYWRGLLNGWLGLSKKFEKIYLKYYM